MLPSLWHSHILLASSDWHVLFFSLEHVHLQQPCATFLRNAVRHHTRGNTLVTDVLRGTTPQVLRAFDMLLWTKYPCRYCGEFTSNYDTGRTYRTSYACYLCREAMRCQLYEGNYQVGEPKKAHSMLIGVRATPEAPPMQREAQQVWTRCVNKRWLYAIKLGPLHHILCQAGFGVDECRYAKKKGVRGWHTVAQAAVHHKYRRFMKIYTHVKAIV